MPAPSVPDSTPAFREDQVSQIPALHLLQNLGFRYLLPGDALELRGGRDSQVLLLDVLTEQLRSLNCVQHRGATQPFTENAIAEAVRQLRDVDDVAGLLLTNKAVWELIRYGIAAPQTIGGDTKSFPLVYVDWNDPTRNVFHVTDEFSVSRVGRDDTYRPDIVAFVNGIPFTVIECKRPGVKDALDEAVSQHIRNQKDDGIPRLYEFAQLLLAVSMNDACYGAACTGAKFFAKWKERGGDDDALAEAVARPLSVAQLDRFFADDSLRFKGTNASRARRWFETTQNHGREITAQDRLIYSTCRPERLLELANLFTIFDGGERKVARYPQYFCVKKAMARLRERDADGTRKGGVVWHTQGSGKSITMVMLAEAILRDPTITNPKIILVTDRVDLDDQIYRNFLHCGAELDQAATGTHLLELLQAPKARIITTLVHKFDTALKNRTTRFEDPNIFVLVDESHRSHFGPLHAQMERVLPRACFVGFTGTPVVKKDRSTVEKFGGLLDTYTIDEAVTDKAVVPLLYEGRLVEQVVEQKAVDEWFGRYTRGLSREQTADLKKKFSTTDQLGRTEQTIRRTAWDISEHFAGTYKGTPFKGQLVAPSKADALLYKKCLDEFGAVSSEVLISAPDDREGHEDVDEIRDAAERPKVQDFWKRMMNRYGDEVRYQRDLISAFTKTETPEIIIVVSKLLVGFDAPRNTVLYLTKKLEGHALLQAIARVNRLYDGKDFGLVVDYRGVLKKLDQALDLYGSFDGEYDEADIAHAVQDIQEETRRLPDRHAEVWEVFREVATQQDAEAMEQALDPDEVRENFYDRLSAFARTLQVALSSAKFLERTPDAKLDRYKSDLRYFMSLRASVQRRYAETVNFKQYQARIQKLLDTHVRADNVEIVVNPVSIFDRDAFQREVDQLGTPASKAHTIANRVKRTITEKMDEDPAFYERFSKMLQDAIARFRQERITDAMFLAEVEGIRDRVRDRTGDDLPAALAHHDVARAYYGILHRQMESLGVKHEDAAVLALRVDAIVEGLRIVHWTRNADQMNRMRTALEDEFHEFFARVHLTMDYSLVDELTEKLLDVARVRRP